MIDSVDNYNNVQKCYYTNHHLIINTVTVKSRELYVVQYTSEKFLSYVFIS